MNEPTVFRTQEHRDLRGSFMEVFRESTHVPVKQLNCLQSIANSFRGVHVTLAPGAGKLVAVLEGVVSDYVVDLRSESPRFGEVQRFDLYKGLALYVPPGFGHGFHSISHSIAVYGLTNEFDPEKEVKLKYNEFDIHLPEDVALSDADKNAMTIEEWSKYHEVCVHFPAP